MSLYAEGIDGGVGLSLTAHDRNEFSRAAVALYARGASGLGTLLSVVAATGGNSLAQVDKALEVYRLWLNDDAPKAGAL